MAAQAADLTVFAAASLKNALDDAAKIYQAKTGDKVSISYAASPALAKQIELGAPADIFFSADLDWMDYLQEKKLIDVGSRHTLLGNTLVLIAPKDLTVSLTIEKNFPLLEASDPTASSPWRCKFSPRGQIRQGRAHLSWRMGCGRAARCTSRECTRRLGLRRPEEAPLGIVYGTDAKSEPAVRVVGTFPEDSHPKILYPIALTASAKPEARKFLEFLISSEAAPSFEAQGFRSKAKSGRTPTMKKISARNQIVGRVVEVRKGQTTAHVKVDIGNGVIVTASITNEAVDDLNLAEDDKVVAIIKASDVMIGK